MAAKEMYDYLSSLVADYTAEELDISAQHKMRESGDKNQEVHVGDDGSEERVSHSDETEFFVDYAYAGLSEIDAGTIFDLYHSSSKANGIENTFYWHHPTDSHIYTVRFAKAIPREIGPSWVHKYGGVSLKILGYKP